jgi:hypothetical protein
MSGNTGSDRGSLGFTEQVLSSFSFLTEHYDFHVVKIKPTIVRYESSSVFINIFHGRSSFELGFEIGRIDDGTGREEYPYRLDTIVELMGAQEKAGATFFQASTRKSVKESVPQLASLAQSCASPFFTNDPVMFERLRKTSLAISLRIMKDLKRRTVRREAEVAWRSKDYAKIADLYESIREDLSPAEMKKLIYSKGHL